MQYLDRCQAGWSIRLYFRPYRTWHEAQVADIVEWRFRPTMTVARLKRLVDAHIRTFPADVQRRFTVAAHPIASRRDCPHSDWVDLYALLVCYGGHPVITLIEPLTADAHVDRQLKDLY